MIPTAYITHWKKYYPWPLDEQVEQDLIICKILLNMYQDPFLSSQLAFRGGTALQKLYFKLPTRYSEDIDLVQISAGPIGGIVNRIREIIDPWLGAPAYRRNEGRFTLYYSFVTENEPISIRKIKIEINTREHFSALGYIERPFSIDSPWFSGETTITTYKIEELLATKLRALFQRKKGRDLFDLGVAMELLEIEINTVIACFQQYMGSKISRAQFEKNLHEKLADISFLAEMHRMLPKNSGFLSKIELYKRDVYKKIIKVLPGEPWKIEFSIGSPA